MSGYINRYILLLKSLPLSLSVSLSPFLPSLHPSFLPSFPLCVCACTHVSVNVPMQVCRCHGTCAETRNQFCASVLPSTLLETRSFVVQTCIWQASTQLSHKILGILLSLLSRCTMGTCHLLVLHGFRDCLLMSSCLCDKHFTLWVISPLLLRVLLSNSLKIPQLLFHWGNKIYPVSSHYRQDAVMEFIFTNLLPQYHDNQENTK